MILIRAMLLLCHIAWKHVSWIWLFSLLSIPITYLYTPNLCQFESSSSTIGDLIVNNPVKVWQHGQRQGYEFRRSARWHIVHTSSASYIIYHQPVASYMTSYHPYIIFPWYGSPSIALRQDYVKSMIYTIQTHPWLSVSTTWWRHQMETLSALLAICAGNSPVPGEFPAQRPVTRSFDVFLDLHPNKRLSKQRWGWWFETLSCPLWRHRNETYLYDAHNLFQWYLKDIAPNISRSSLETVKLNVIFEMV